MGIPLAFIVVEGETETVWRWFISCIYNLISSVHLQCRITFIPDRHKERSNSHRDGWPYPYSHRYYLRHIRANFQKKFEDKILHILLWDASCATNPEVYKDTREKLKVVCENADNWIETSL